MQLDVKKIVQPNLTNYNEHVIQYVRMLNQISFVLVYLGPSDIRDHVRDKTVYACSIKSSTLLKPKTYRSVFPVMIGSRLDTCIRKLGMTTFTEDDLTTTTTEELPFVTADIAVTLFLINGCLKQLPCLFTNDPTNCHVVANSYVCCYTWDGEDRGKKLSLYVDNWDSKYARGNIVVSLNDGKENGDVQSFFDQCPYPVRQDVYMTKIFREGRFDIDHLTNKVVVSPGHMFVRLFMKYLYQPLRDKNWSAAKPKAAMIVKSIESGALLHVLSRKTAFHCESNSSAKMVQTPTETYRELGMNGEVYVEKNSGCYREVKMQTYPLIPYLSHLIVRQISSKVKNVDAYPESYRGFLCYLGILETKNIGRTHVMARNTYISTGEDLPRLYEILALEYTSEETGYYVVVNEACIPVTETSFRAIRLDYLKEQLLFVECFRDDRFVYIRYKVGLLFKWMERVWVTARDELYWSEKLFNLSTKDALIEKFEFDYLTSHLVDLNPYFKHNMFAKNILAFNALKNAILASNRQYSIYFMETLSGYVKMTPYHSIVCEPVDSFSRHFTLFVPRVVVGYMSLDGNNQEDCIAVRGDLDAFDSYRFYTIRVKIEVETPAKIVFYPVRGELLEDNFLGDLVCHCSKMNAVAQSIYVRLVKVNDSHVKLSFDRPYTRILEYDLTNERLIVSMEQFHASGMGDKLCSFHGQKGVLRKTDKMPSFDDGVFPDLLVNPYCITTRLTAGQIQEQLNDCRDAQVLRNSDGRLLPGQSALYGRVFYFAIAYFSSEHIYVPTKCNIDKILGQPVKGRSRKGGMKLGNMEIMNGMRGTGIASCFEEKVCEHGDRIFHGIPIPKSVSLCTEDAKVYKFNMTYNTEPCITEEE